VTTESLLNELIQGRLEQARICIEDARLLATTGRGGLSAVNRAYYAMFYAALALLQRIGKASSKHSGVIGIFDREFVKTGIFPKKYSMDFHEAFELRQATDYKSLQPISSEQVWDIIQKAESFVAEVALRIGERTP
jgi:uncharacterized protein (UPF0332 family)